MIVKRIEAMSLARITGIIYAGIGLVVGAFLGVFTMLGGVLGAGVLEDFGPVAGLFFGIGAMITLPLVYGIMGFIGGLFVASIYNLAAGSLGGVRFVVE